MPKRQRSPEEVETIKDNIVNHALELLAEDGYDGFSMRKLGARLGIAAKTIYNYYRNQDELYLCILTRGFEQLRSAFESASSHKDKPRERVQAAIAAYVDFGLTHANLYNLMFTWHVPKYNDYVDTPVEPIAHQELVAALTCPEFFICLIVDCLPGKHTLSEETLRLEMIHVWTQLHGFVAGINNSLLSYMHESPLSLKNAIVDRVADNLFRRLDMARNHA